MENTTESTISDNTIPEPVILDQVTTSSVGSILSNSSPQQQSVENSLQNNENLTQSNNGPTADSKNSATTVRRSNRARTELNYEHFLEGVQGPHHKLGRPKKNGSTPSLGRRKAGSNKKRGKFDDSDDDFFEIYGDMIYQGTSSVNRKKVNAPQTKYAKPVTWRELKQDCIKLVTNLMEHKYAFPFNVPVDPIRDSVPHYHDVIKKPMDFGTILVKLQNGQYNELHEFEHDIRLIFNNCWTFNSPEHLFCSYANSIFKAFNKSFKPLQNKYSKTLQTAEIQSTEEMEEMIQQLQVEEEQLNNELNEFRNSIYEFDEEPDQEQTVFTKKQKSESSSNKSRSRSNKSRPRANRGRANQNNNIQNNNYYQNNNNDQIYSDQSNPSSLYQNMNPQDSVFGIDHRVELTKKISNLSEDHLQQMSSFICQELGLELNDELELDLGTLKDDLLFKIEKFVSERQPLPSLIEDQDESSSEGEQNENPNGDSHTLENIHGDDHAIDNLDIPAIPNDQ